jgi:hypothetical protein
MIVPGLDGETANLERRLLIGGALASGLSHLVGPAQAQPRGKSEAFDWTNAEDNLRAFVKLTGDLAPRKVFAGWYSGHVFGLFEGKKPDPLFRMEGFGIGWMERQPDGSYHHAWKEIGLYSDLATGTPLQRWYNPYLEEWVEPLFVQNRRVNLTLAASYDQMFKIPPEAKAELRFGNYPAAGRPGNPMLLQWMEAGDMTSVWNDLMGEVQNRMQPKDWPRESTGERMPVAEFFGHNAKTADLFDPALTSAPSSGAWVRIAPWLPWMLMGRHPGGLFYKASTRKCTSLNEVPSPLLAYAEKNFPEFLEPPTEWKLPNEGSWEVYQRTRKPAPPKAEKANP